MSEMHGFQGRLQGKMAVVTGSGSGIGRAAAIAFAKEGARVVVSCRTKDQGEATVQSIRAAGGGAIYIAADVACEEDVKALIEETVGTFGRKVSQVVDAVLRSVEEHRWVQVG